MLICSASIYTLLTPVCENPYPLQWIYDDVCHMTVDPRHAVNGFFFMGYLLQDFIQMKFWIRDSSKNAQEMTVHHIFATIATLLCLNSGYMSIGLVNLMTLMEFSTPPLNYRWLYPKEELGNFTP